MEISREKELIQLNGKVEPLPEAAAEVAEVTPDAAKNEAPPLRYFIGALWTALFGIPSHNYSSFFPPQAVESCFRMGTFAIYRRLDQMSNFMGTLFKFNLFFFAAVVLYCTFQVCTVGDALHSSWLGPPLLAAVLPTIIAITVFLLIGAGFVSFLELPKRLRIMPWGMALRVDLTEDVFAEIDLPWSNIVSVKFSDLSRFNSVAEPYVVIETIFGVKHFVRQSEMLLDNSEASFLNSLATWAPYLIPRAESKTSGGPKFTELWLHQFSTANKRRELANLPEGTLLKNGSYRIAGMLGGGGQGTAYLAVVEKAVQLLDDRGPGAESSILPQSLPESLPQPLSAPLSLSVGGEVVLKEYIMPIYQGSRAIEALTMRLEQEAEVLRQIDHPGVVKLYDCFQEDHRGYLVLEYVAGKSLKDLVAAQGALSEKEALRLAIDLCRALVYMHGMMPPVVHRDLSPDNIMLGDSGVKIVDFNVARRLEPGSGSTVVGKHSYIPPEQFRGKPSVQSDIYAFGGTLFYLLTAEEPEPLTVSHPSIVNKKISAALDELVAHCTALEETKRISSFSAVLDALVKIYENC